MEMLPILIIAASWVFVSMMYSVVKKSTKNTAQKRGARPGPAPSAGPKSVPEAGQASLPGTVYSTPEPFRHDDSLYKGSLNAETGEGYDPCHDEQMAPLTLLETEPETAPAAPGAPGLRLTWTSNAIVQGMVMSEILNRKHS